MANRVIRLDGDPLLRKKSREVESFDEKLSILIDDMKETMYKYGGIGLAAPQVGILKRVIVVDIGQGPIELVNPEIVYQARFVKGREGCLSCPDILGVVKRPSKVTVRGFDRDGKEVIVKGEALMARALCHEVDHLDGILFKDIAQEIIYREDQEEMLKKHTKKQSK